MHPMTDTEKRMADIWRTAEQVGTENAWYEAFSRLFAIYDAISSAENDLRNNAAFGHAHFMALSGLMTDWSFLSSLALQRALMASREAKTVRLQVAA